MTIDIIKFEVRIVTGFETIKYHSFFACCWCQKLMISVCLLDMMVMIVMVVIVMLSMMIVVSSVVTIMMVVIVPMSSCSSKPTLSNRKCPSRLKQTSLYNHF